MKITILGYMGSGKSSCGKKLAKALQLPFYDLDDEFEKKYKIQISSFFKKYKEGMFRVLESKLLEEFLNKNEDFVLSLGGGTPCFSHNINLILEKSFSVYLQASPKTLVNRLQKSKVKRPLIQKVKKDELPAFIEKQLREREHYYLQAVHIQKAESIDIKQFTREIQTVFL